MSSIQFLFALCLLTLGCNSQEWRGNYGSRTICSYKMVWQCAYRTWRACCYYRWVTVPNYYTQYFCLPGWKERSSGSKDCNEAICNPPCKNGTCTSPNKCTCNSGYNGPTCEGKLCSHLKPCYPGSCSKLASGSNCTCSDGFSGSANGRECLTLVSPDQRPEIYQCRLRISQFIKTKQMEMFGVMLDASYNNDTNSVEIWTNRRGFNRVNYTGIAFYNPVDLSPIPSDYISDVKLGIVGGSFNTVHTKFDNATVTYPNQVVCDNTDVNKDNPKSGIFNCIIKNHINNLLTESGDRIAITFTANAGGYRQLKNIDSGADHKKQYYIQTTMSKTLTYRFDFDKPKHCLPNCSNNETLLEYGAEYRQDPTLNLRWNGWEDQLSGVARYAWEIFELKANGDEELREPVPLGPIKIAEVNHSDTIDYPSYTLPEPGLYSIILQVADTANNSVYIRRFCLYDPVSTVQLSNDPNTRLRVTSASPESNFTWQGNIDGIIRVNWTNYFFNEFVEKNHLLNKILDYPLQFVDEGQTEIKKIADVYKNIAGRTQQAVPNTRGITKFQIGHHRDSNGGKNKPAEPNVWNNLTDPISTIHTLTISVSNGETVVVYVKAIDPSGRERVETTEVNFDSTPPVVTTFDFEITPDNTSSLSAVASDPDSGVLLVSWRAVRLDTNTEYAAGQLFWSSITKECNDVSRCMCIVKFDQCFQLATQLSFDNCQIAIAGLSNAVTVELSFSVMNQAKVGSEETVYKISDIREVSDVCLGPVGLSGGAIAGISIGPAGLSGGAIAGISIGVILLIIIAVLIFLFLTNRQPFTERRKERGTVYIRNMLGKSTATNQHTASPSSSYPNNAYRADEDEVYYYGGMDFQKGQSWQIPHDHLALLGTITEGKFAKICQAKIRSRSEQVVAKMLKDGYTSDDEIFMRAKVNYNATVVGKDPNVLEFIGAVVDNEVLGPVLILEYCEQGQLDKWLLKQRGDINDDTIEILQRIAFDVCKGMAYLASKKIVHQKLAARNVLLTFTRVAKVAGFGPSKPEKETINHYDNASNAKKERIPIKWTAPECLVSLKDANEKSDVWSYGIVLWEIFSLGETPYNDMKSRDVETKVKSGYRMSKPEICEDFHYDVMKNCWEENPKKRHSFKTIKGHIAKTFSTNTRDSVYYYK